LSADRSGSTRRVVGGICLALVAVASGLVSVGSGAALGDQTPQGKIAYTTWPMQAGPPCLHVLDLRRAVPKKLVCGPVGEGGGHLGSGIAWSPDGTSLAYKRAGSRPGIYVVGADGGSAHRVMPLARSEAGARNIYAAQLSTASWSPDGTRLVFDRWGDAEYWMCTRKKPSRLRLTVAQLSPAKLVEIPALTQPTRLKTIGDLAWSPGGDQLLYVVFSYRPYKSFGSTECDITSTSLYTINTDGSDRRLLVTARNISLVAWSPDGSTIAYTGCQTGNPATCGLYELSSDGTGRRLLTRVRTYADAGDPGLNLAWSPLGQSIFVQGRDLYEDDATSGARHRVAIPQQVDPGGCFPEETLLALSVDGKWLGAVSTENFVFNDCKDPLSLRISVIPLDVSAGPLKSIQIAPTKRGLDSVALHLN
jgi:dipeptidyl aminopeptidase/acylaminoacyl peptidase